MRRYSLGLGGNMHDQRCVFVARGEIEAQQIHAFLASEGIEAVLRGEALRNTHGLTIDGLGAVQILVREEDEERARALLTEAEAGKLRIS